MKPTEEAVYHYLVWKGLDEPHRTEYLTHCGKLSPGFLRMANDRPTKGQYRKALYAAFSVLFAFAIACVLSHRSHVPQESLLAETCYNAGL